MNSKEKKGRLKVLAKPNGSRRVRPGPRISTRSMQRASGERIICAAFWRKPRRCQQCFGGESEGEIMSNLDPRHSRGQRIHDSQDGLLRSWCWLKKEN